MGATSKLLKQEDIYLVTQTQLDMRATTQAQYIYM
jgi:hypothetical protein